MKALLKMVNMEAVESVGPEDGLTMRPSLTTSPMLEADESGEQ